MLLIAALLIKIVAGTACMMDTPRVASTPSIAGDTPVAATVQAAIDATAPPDGCILGEVGGCHCACAHAAVLPTTAPVVATVVGLPEVVSHLPATPLALAARSPLRPPIA